MNIAAFVNCHFRTAAVLFPLDTFAAGISVLALGGSLTYTGCTFTNAILFINGAVVGGVVAIFGGEAVFTGCSFITAFGAANAGGTGLGLFVGGK